MQALIKIKVNYCMYNLILEQGHIKVNVRTLQNFIQLDEKNLILQTPVSKAICSYL